MSLSHKTTTLKSEDVNYGILNETCCTRRLGFCILSLSLSLYEKIHPTCKNEKAGWRYSHT